MPSILSDEDKQTVKRTVPKPSNKILAVAVARLYIAYPDPSRWVFTGLQGAAVLANDLVGNTMWIKLVDISVSGFLPCISSNPLTARHSHPAEASYGTRRSSTPSPTTRTVPSSIALKSRAASVAFHLPMRRRPELSGRRWTSGKRMPTRTPDRGPLPLPAAWPMVGITTTSIRVLRSSITACLVASLARSTPARCRTRMEHLPSCLRPLR
jgi:hypothetical protein